MTMQIERSTQWSQADLKIADTEIAIARLIQRNMSDGDANCGPAIARCGNKIEMLLAALRRDTGCGDLEFDATLYKDGFVSVVISGSGG